MADLIAKSPCAGLDMPRTARARLAEFTPGPVTSVAPFGGRADAVNAALAPLGLGFPAPDRMRSAGPARIVWTGRNQAFLLGIPAPETLRPLAALTDQSDGWACLQLSGPDSAAVLARLVPLDLRAAAFPPGASARVPLNHMQAILMHLAPDTFDIMVFRSMARTAVHELAEAMTMVAARA